ncbi:hypothetical protein [Kribbella sp. NPDC048915]|uniref:hypothetical protein n=1 Tax=Kribbella sp. NPDC048915 TaxID=3155148 RepID=UPI0033C88093
MTEPESDRTEDRAVTPSTIAGAYQRGELTRAQPAAGQGSAPRGQGQGQRPEHRQRPQQHVGPKHGIDR